MTTVDGEEEVNKSHYDLLTLMLKYGIEDMTVEYSGGGDSGDISEPVIITRTEDSKISDKDWVDITNLTSDVIEHIVAPDFNNDGSSGNAQFKIVEGVLKFTCDHSTYFTSSDDSSFEEDLIDGTLI